MAVLSEEDAVIKIVTVGDGSVGKTCMLMSYTRNQFPTDYVPTIFDNYSCTVLIDGQETPIELWDTAGQEDYKRLRALSYWKAHVFVLAFSLVAPASFENVACKWVPDLRKSNPDTPIVLVGTKLDMRENYGVVRELEARGETVITAEMGERMRAELGADQYMECSALTQVGLKPVFDAAILAALARRAAAAPAAKSNRENKLAGAAGIGGGGGGGAAARGGVSAKTHKKVSERMEEQHRKRAGKPKDAQLEQESEEAEAAAAAASSSSSGSGCCTVQ